jgi:lipoprotein-anchoring transpeptidase ErfK/SrfK
MKRNQKEWQTSKGFFRSGFIATLCVLATRASLGAAGAVKAPSSEPGVSQTRSNSGMVIVVSIPDKRLALLKDGHVVKEYTVAVGRALTPSPSGQFTIVNRVVNPAYYGKGFIIPPGPRNPVGDRWMGLSDKGFGIHGTNAPSSIGKAASHGCIRMRKHDVEQLFEMVRIGDRVEIHAQRDPETALIFAEPKAALHPEAKRAAGVRQVAPAIAASVPAAAF